MLSHSDLARLVAASYALGPSVEAGDDVRAVYTSARHEFAVAVPGTTDVAGWLRDFNAWPEWFPTIGLFHQGFGSGILALWAKVRLDLPIDQRAVYTGHSLGGILAQGLAACHAAEGRARCRCVTFGSPRGALLTNFTFGWRARQAVDLALYQRAGDPVPLAPPWPLYKRAARPRVIGTPVAEPIANHDIDRYAADLTAAGL